MKAIQERIEFLERIGYETLDDGWIGYVGDVLDEYKKGQKLFQIPSLGRVEDTFIDRWKLSGNHVFKIKLNYNIRSGTSRVFRDTKFDIIEISRYGKRVIY